jgi:hypothetical protein
MGYVHPDKPDIFLSYAHVNDEPHAAFPDRPGWVTTLVRGLKQRLANKFGHGEFFVLWSDANLAGHVELTPEILGRLRNAAVLLLIMSPAYLASEWCRRELVAFHEEIRRRKAVGGRVFVIEFDKVEPGERPAELADLKGYRFWIEDPDTGNPETLGYPIVRQEDTEYHKRHNDLCIELVRQLKALRQSDPATPASVTTPPSEARPAVYLAEVTEDLESRREDVRRHLEQAGLQVLPGRDLSRADHEAYRVQVDAELAKSRFFVQLLNETPGRRLEGGDASYVAVQHDRALAAGKPVLQWRRRELDTASGEIPEAHRRRLNGTTVVAADLSEFKRLIVETVKKLTAPTDPVIDRPDPGDSDKLVFINAEETDLKAGQVIIDLLKKTYGIGTLPPVRGTSPEIIRTALKTRMLSCDGMVLVHGTNPDWPVLQWNHFRKIKAEREVAIRAVGLCDLPPPDKPMKAADVLQIPSVLVIDCCDGLAAEKFATFLKHL